MAKFTSVKEMILSMDLDDDVKEQAVRNLDKREEFAERFGQMASMFDGEYRDKMDLLLSAMTGERGEDQNRISCVSVDLITTMLQKNQDYGCAVFDVPVLAPGMNAGDAILVRMSDKVSRLSNLFKTGKPSEVNESIEDTLKDLGAYAILYLARPRDGEGEPNGSNS